MQLCQKGGWTKLIDASAHQFTSENACVSYAAHDGAIYALATLQLEPCASQPFDGLCVNPSGSGLKAYSASATGTSADSLTYPKVAGIPISSNTAERTSACP